MFKFFPLPYTLCRFYPLFITWCSLPFASVKGERPCDILGGPHCGSDATWSQRDDVELAISKGQAPMSAEMRTTGSDPKRPYNDRTPWVVYLAINDLLSSAASFSNRGRLKTHKTRGSSRSSCLGLGAGAEGRRAPVQWGSSGRFSPGRSLSTWLGLDIWIPQTISCQSTIPLGLSRTSE
jgi:hypothetical protein